MRYSAVGACLQRAVLLHEEIPNGANDLFVLLADVLSPSGRVVAEARVK